MINFQQARNRWEHALPYERAARSKFTVHSYLMAEGWHFFTSIWKEKCPPALFLWVLHWDVLIGTDTSGVAWTIPHWVLLRQKWLVLQYWFSVSLDNKILYMQDDVWLCQPNRQKPESPERYFKSHLLVKLRKITWCVQ